MTPHVPYLRDGSSTTDTAFSTRSRNCELGFDSRQGQQIVPLLRSVKIVSGDLPVSFTVSTDYCFPGGKDRGQ
jgi:hypothetical protein